LAFEIKDYLGMAGEVETEYEKYEKGDTKQFTISFSISPGTEPLLSIYDKNETLVSSVTASQSSDYDYYVLQTLPSTVGMYSYVWKVTVGGKDYISRGLFEVVETTADEAGLYSHPNDLRQLYKKLDQLELTNEDLRQYIADADAVINARLSSMYSVPFATSVSSFPPLIGKLSKTLALIEILDDHAIQVGADLLDWITRKREVVENTITALEVGSLTLVNTAGDAITKKVDTEVWSSTKDYHPTFAMIEYEEQFIDDDRIDDEEDERDL